MARDWLSLTDEGLEAFLEQLSTKISAGPTGYGLDAAIATLLASKKTAYSSALAAATDPATRGRHTIYLKQQVRRDVVDYTRKVVAQIQGTMTVTPSQKDFLGIPTHDNPRTPIEPQTEPPVATCIEMNGWTAEFELRPMSSEGRSHKADGAIGVNIYSFAGPTPPNDIRDWDFEGDTTRAKFRVQFDSNLAVGTKVWVCVQWKSPRFQTGPACTPIGLIVGGGVPQVAG